MPITNSWTEEPPFYVAVIDQGVESSHKRLSGCIIKTTSVGEGSREEDDTGHGTAMAHIIHSLSPDVGIYDIKMQTHDNKVTESLLCEALYRCASLEDVRVVNLSMGILTDNPSSDLYEACKRNSDKGKLVVAAGSYNNTSTGCYPAHFPFIYGVSVGTVESKTDYHFREGEPIDILAKGTTQRVPHKNNLFNITAGASLAAAHFSGILSNLLLSNPGINIPEVRRLVKAGSNPHVHPIYNSKFKKSYLLSPHQSPPPTKEKGRGLFCHNLDIQSFAHQVGLFPISEKEINTIVEFKTLFDIPVTALLDYPVPTGSIQKKANRDMKICRDLSTFDYDGIDTMVFGYFMDQLLDVNICFGLTLLRTCLYKNKHVIIWDKDVYRLTLDIIRQEIPAYSGQLRYVGVDPQKQQDILAFRRLPLKNTPIVAVIGTASRQGKVTLQLTLRKALEDYGYRVAHLCTEPQGVLLNAEFLFPYGHKGTVEPDESTWDQMLKVVIKGIANFNDPDIIITGMQGELLPQVRLYNRDAKGYLESFHFLMGVQPDALICTITANDDVQYIQETIQLARILLKASILFCCINPAITENIRDERLKRPLSVKRTLSEDELKERIEFYSEKLKIPVFDIKDASTHNNMIRLIQETFSTTTT